MKKKNYKDLLNASVEQATPALRDDVKRAPIVTTAQVTPSAAPRKSARTYRRAPLRAAMAACLALVLVLSVVAAVMLMNQNTPFVPTDTPATDYRSYITVDINPSFSLTVDAQGNVTHVVAENYDGEVVLDSIDAEGVSLNRPYETTLRLLLGYAKALGYFTTSDGINIDIYNYNTDTAVRQEMQSHIASAVSSVGRDTPPLSIHEMAKETMLSIVQEMYADATEELGDDDLFRYLEGKRGYGERRHEKEHDAGTDPSECRHDDTLLTLSLLYYSAEALDELDSCLTHVETTAAARGMTVDALFAEGGQYIRMMCTRVDTLLTWMGDTRTLTQETYEVLREEATLTIAEADYHALVTYYLAYRMGAGMSLSTVADALTERLLREHPQLAAVCARIEARYIQDAASVFKIVTALERTWREATQMYGTLDWFLGTGFGHGNKGSGNHPEGENGKK